MHRTVVALACALAIAGCRPTQLAGRSLGQYAVTGTLEENECAAGYPVPPSTSFYVELRREPGSSVGYWKLPDGPLAAGSIDGDGRFRFEQRVQVSAIAPDVANGVAGCVLERAEVVRGQLDAAVLDGGEPDAGTSASDLRGETIITVSPVPGGNCSPLLVAFGGAFPALPCELRYALDGERLDEPLW